MFLPLHPLPLPPLHLHFRRSSSSSIPCHSPIQLSSNNRPLAIIVIIIIQTIPQLLLRLSLSLSLSLHHHQHLLRVLGPGQLPLMLLLLLTEHLRLLLGNVVLLLLDRRLSSCPRCRWMPVNDLRLIPGPSARAARLERNGHPTVQRSHAAPPLRLVTSNCKLIK